VSVQRRKRVTHRRSSKKRRKAQRQAQIIFSLLLGFLALWGLEYIPYVDMTPRARVYVVLSIIGLVFIIPWSYWIYCFMRRHLKGMFRPGYVYVIFGRHPKSGRITCSWVGLTRRTSNDVRIREHLYGSAHYGILPKPWADLVTDYKVKFSFRHIPQFMLSWIEITLIIYYRPLYNDQWNRGNVRRIPPWEAEQQRAARDPHYVIPHQPRRRRVRVAH
jgi:hypothetical protein